MFVGFFGFGRWEKMFNGYFFTLFVESQFFQYQNLFFVRSMLFQSEFLFICLRNCWGWFQEVLLWLRGKVQRLLSLVGFSGLVLFFFVVVVDISFFLYGWVIGFQLVGQGVFVIYYCRERFLQGEVLVFRNECGMWGVIFEIVRFSFLFVK